MKWDTINIIHPVLMWGHYDDMPYMSPMLWWTLYSSTIHFYDEKSVKGVLSLNLLLVYLVPDRNPFEGDEFSPPTWCQPEVVDFTT